MAPIRILFVEHSTFSSYGGSKRVLVNVLANLDRARFEPHVLFCSVGPYVKDVADLGISVSAPYEVSELIRSGEAANQNAGNDHGKSLRTFDRPVGGEIQRSPLRLLVRDIRSHYYYRWRDPIRARSLARFLPQDMDLIHFNAPMQEHYGWALVAYQRGIPYLTHEHGIWRRPPSAFKQVARHAAAVICLTEERARQVREFCGDRVHTEVVPNGVDVTKQQPHRKRPEVRAEFGIGESTSLLVTASHILPWKGQDLGVEAARRLRDGGSDFRWIFCGSQSHPEFVARLHRQIETANLTDRVILLDQRDDVPDLFAAADVVVHTSIRPEPFGMAVIEAMCVGTPVVGPAEGAISGILRNDVDGRLYIPRDSSSLAAAIQGLLNDPVTRRRLGEKGRERVLESYTVAKQVERLSTIYENAVAASRAV